MSQWTTFLSGPFFIFINIRSRFNSFYIKHTYEVCNFTIHFHEFIKLLI